MKAQTTLLIITTLCSLGAGCRPRHHVPEQSTTEMSAQSTAKAEQRSLYFVTGPDEAVTTDVALAEVSILSPHKAVLRLKGLEPGRTYRGQTRLQDSGGTLLVDMKGSFVPTERDWPMWYTFQPDAKKHKAGKWTWSTRIDGVGYFTAEFTVLPPTPADLEKLARYEQAAEEAFKAFSHYWLGWSNNFFAMVVNKTWFGMRGGLGVTMTSTNHPTVAVSLLQVSGLEYRFNHEHVSAADRLNGISYRGSADFTFDTYRYWTEQEGWREWNDTSKHDNAFTEALFPYSSTQLPSEFKEDFNLHLRIEHKDGHWRVTTDSGELFVNGQFVVTTPKFLKRVELFQPDLKAVQTLAPTRGARRAQDLTTGAQIKASPEDIDRNTITTMTMLRGRIL